MRTTCASSCGTHKYQRNYAPLMLLWRGIGQFIVLSPQYAVLFGAVSISNDYESASRQLIVDYLKANNIEDVSRLVKQIERDSKGVLVLLKQYLKLGGGCSRSAPMRSSTMHSTG